MNIDDVLILLFSALALMICALYFVEDRLKKIERLLIGAKRGEEGFNKATNTDGEKD